MTKIQSRHSGLKSPQIPKICLIFLIGIVFFLSMKIPHESDFFQHLTHGEDFIEHPSFEARNDWSHTAKAERWIRWTFLYAVLLAMAFKFLGLSGIWLVQAVSLVLLTAILWRYCRHVKLNAWENLFLFALFFCAIHFRLNYRAENLAYVFFLLNLLWLHGALIGKRKLNVIYVGFLVFWQLYQNSIYLGLVPFGIFTILACGRKRSSKPFFFFLAALTVLIFAHVDGYRLHLRFFQGYQFHRNLAVHELKPPLGSEFVYFWLCMLLACIGLFFRKGPKTGSQLDKYWLITRHPEKYFMPACFVFFAVSACFAARAIPFALLCGFVFYQRGLRQVLEPSGRLRHLVALGLGLGTVLIFSNFNHEKYSPGRALDPKYHPEQVADFILQTRPPGKIYHPIYPAGYFLWRFRGNPPVFFDFRLELYLGLIEEIRRANMDSNAFISFLRKYGITYAVEARHELHTMSHRVFRHWPLVYRNQTHDIRMDDACGECRAYIDQYRIPESK